MLDSRSGPMQIVQRVRPSPRAARYNCLRDSSVRNGAQRVNIRLVLADDHVLVRQGLRKLLESSGFVVVGEAADGREAVRLVRSENPDVAVMDIGMPLFNGLNAALELTHSSPKVRLIVLTQHDEAQ